MAEKKRVQIELLDLAVTEAKGDYYGRTKPSTVLDNEAIADRIKAKGSEFQKSTLVALFNQGDEERVAGLAEGAAIKTGWAHGRLGVEGVFYDMNFDRTKQKLTVKVHATKAVLEQIKNVQVEVVGIADTAPMPMNAFDTETEQTNSTITPGEVLQLEGNNLKVVGSSSDTGVWFVSEDDGMRTQATKIYTNEPMTLLLKVPDLPTGNYSVEVATQFSKNTETKKIKKGTLPHVLTVL